MGRWLFSDVDETLVLWDHDSPKYTHLPTVFVEGTQLKLHTKHIRIIKAAYDRGDTVVVWSRAGVEWARAVVKAVGLMDYVDYILQKPDTCIDDERTLRWLHPKPLWYSP